MANIPLYIFNTISLSVHLSMDSLFPYLGSSKQCCSEQRDCRYLSAFVFSFSEDKYSEVDLDGSYDISIFIFWGASVLSSLVAVPTSPLAVHKHFLFSTLCAVCLVTQSCPTLCNPRDCSPPGSSAMGFSRQEYWSGCHALLQGIFPTQALNPGLPHCRQILYHLSHKGSPH